MWSRFFLIDFWRAHKKSREHLSPNGKEDATKGMFVILLLVGLVCGGYLFTIYRCYSLTNELELCKGFTVEQINGFTAKQKMDLKKYD